MKLQWSVKYFMMKKLLRAGTTQFSKKRSKNGGANENISCWFPSIPGIAPGVAPRIAAFALPKSWDAIPHGISYSENGISNPESCSENTPERSQSSKNGLFTPRAFFQKLGWFRKLDLINQNCNFNCSALLHSELRLQKLRIVCGIGWMRH